MKISIYGDSYIEYLKTSRHASNIVRMTDSRGERHSIHLQGKPGLPAARATFRRSDQDVVIIHVGGNDFQIKPGVMQSSTPLQVINRLTTLVEEVRYHSPLARILIMEVLPRFASTSGHPKYRMNSLQAAQFRTWAAEVNQRVENLWGHGGRDGVYAFHSREFHRLHTGHIDYMARDGVHLNEKGLYRFARDVRYAVLFGVKQRLLLD